MSTVNTVSDSFKLHLSSNFVPKELELLYLPMVNARHGNFVSVVDYINHTIKDITMPSLTFPTVSQKVAFGKEYTFRGSGAPNDTFGRELNITFQLVDFHMTYMIISHCLQHHYATTDPIFFKEIIVSLLDENKRVLYRIYYQKIVFKSFSDSRLSNAEKAPDEKTATLGFIYNEIDLEIVPVESYEPGDGVLIEPYSDIIEQGITGNNPILDPKSVVLPEPVPAQPAPTNGVVNSERNTFTFTPEVGITAKNYEMSLGDNPYEPLSGETTLLTSGDLEIYIGNIYVPAGKLKLRLRAHKGLPASAVLSNTEDFLFTVIG